LNQEQIDKLDELGVEWSTKKGGSPKTRWSLKFEQLKAFKEKYGHTNVPFSVEWRSLQQWLYGNKRRKGGPYDGSPQLNTEQIDKLNELGIDWTFSSSNDNSQVKTTASVAGKNYNTDQESAKSGPAKKYSKRRTWDESYEKGKPSSRNTASLESPKRVSGSV